jgi:hypothetical protein
MVGSVLVLLLAGVAFLFVMIRTDARRYPALGEMVGVGGYNSLVMYAVRHVVQAARDGSHL